VPTITSVIPPRVVEGGLIESRATASDLVMLAVLAAGDAHARQKKRARR